MIYKFFLSLKEIYNIFKMVRDYFYYFFFLIFIFLISNLLPWTNPYPEYSVYKPIENFIFFWQYNADTPGEVLSSLYFPDYFEKNNTRLERPGYLILSFFFSKILIFLNDIIHLNIPKLYLGAAGYLITKFLFYFIAICMCVKIYEKYFNRKTARLLTFLLFISWESIRMISQLATSEFQFLFPIIATYLVLNVDEDKIFKSIIFILIIGFLITVRHNIAIILTIVTYLLFKKKIKNTILFCFFISIFPILYLIYIKLIGYEIYFHLFESDHQYGSWLITSEIKIILIKLLKSFIVFLKYNFDYYFLFLIPTVYFFLQKNNYQKYKKEILFCSLLIFFTFIQGFSANKFGRLFFDQMSYHTRAYMVGDYAFIVFGTFGFLLEKNLFKIKRYLSSIILLWFIYSCTFFVNLPWENPKNQPSRDWKSRIINLPD